MKLTKNKNQQKTRQKKKKKRPIKKDVEKKRMLDSSKQEHFSISGPLVSSRKKNLKRKRSSTSKGAMLLEQVLSFTGIPYRIWHSELKTIFEKKNIDMEGVTIEQLRGVVATYLREIMGSLLEKNLKTRWEQQREN